MDNNPPLGAAIPEQPMQQEQPMQPMQPIQQPMQPVQPMQQPTNANNKNETPGLIIGIISIVLAISVFGSGLAFILSIIGIVINSSYLKHGGTKKTGLILSIVSLVLSIGAAILLIIGVIALIFGAGPLGTWSCEAISISSGKPISGYTAEIELGLSSYKISTNYGDQKMIVSGSGVSTKIKGESNEDLHYAIELDKPSEATVNGKTDSDILNNGISNLEMVVNSKNPNESIVVLEDSLRMFQCKKK